MMATRPHERESAAPRRLAVVGSRDYPDLAAVRRVVQRLEPEAVVISGGARGVDRTAIDEARRRGLACEVYPADWSKGRSAGYQRNVTIVDRCTEVVAFWDGVSRGTAHTIRLARAAGKPVTIYHAEANPPA